MAAPEIFCDFCATECPKGYPDQLSEELVELLGRVSAGCQGSELIPPNDEYCGLPPILGEYFLQESGRLQNGTTQFAILVVPEAVLDGAYSLSDVPGPETGIMEWVSAAQALRPGESAFRGSEFTTPSPNEFL